MFKFDNSYAQLPEVFFENVAPTAVRHPSLIKLNTNLSKELGIDSEELASDLAANIFSGNQIAEGSHPIAMTYAGHQFGGWVPQLGDGRAVLLGEVIDKNGIRQDIQLKGSGPTRFSRSGDGRAWVGPVLREYVISEAMAAYGIPTTRALAAVTTGENVYREEVMPGAILTRVSSSHIRVGTFQYFAARQDWTSLKTLADYVIDRHFPEIAAAENPYLALLSKMISGQAKLVSKWMGVGFIHGVMNTDNALISGETIDYGPCAFMDTYNPETVFSSIDRMGRYAYQNQPYIAMRNAAYFASCLLPLISDNDDEAMSMAEPILDSFQHEYQSEWSKVLCAKLGFKDATNENAILGQDLLTLMTKHKADFTLAFRSLSHASHLYKQADARLSGMFGGDAEFDKWYITWQENHQTTGVSDIDRIDFMKSVNPAIIPRNHLVEDMIEHAVEGDFSAFEKLHKALENPYLELPEFEAYQYPPKEKNPYYQTFCGT